MCQEDYLMLASKKPTRVYQKGLRITFIGLTAEKLNPNFV